MRLRILVFVIVILQGSYIRFIYHFWAVLQIRSLKVFCDVVALRSFSRAASANGITQSGASQMVNHLEQRLGVRLMDRSRRPFVLTPEGETYYEGCREIVQHYYALEEEIRTPRQEVAGLVRVASIYSVGLSHLKPFVERFQADHPQAEVRVQYEHPKRVYELVESDEVDTGLVSYPRQSPTILTEPWLEESMVVVCAPTDALARQEAVALRELAGQAMVGFDNELPIRREVDREFKARGIEVSVSVEFDNIEAVKRAIEMGAGIGLLPESTVAREIEIGTLSAVPLATEPLAWPVGIIQRRGKELGRTARRFIEQLRERATSKIELGAV